MDLFQCIQTTRIYFFFEELTKVLSKVVPDRLYYIAETNNMFSRFQAGFRKGRSCEDQITGIVQAIEDGFQ